MENYQTNGKVICMNSKLDFIQPLRTQLTVMNKAINYAPGAPDVPSKNSRPIMNPKSIRRNDEKTRRKIMNNRQEIKPIIKKMMKKVIKKQLNQGSIL